MLFLKHFLFDSAFRRTQLLASKRFQKLFPGLYLRMLREPAHILTSGEALSRYTRLHVILRTTDAVMNVNQGRKLEKIGLHTKKDVIRMGSGSVATAAREFAARFGDDKLEVSIVADRLSKDGIELYDELFHGCRFRFESAAPGNAATFRKQIDLALRDDDKTLVAIYEDDYLTDPSAFCLAFKLFNTVQKLSGYTPHNHPDVLRNALLTRLYRIGGESFKMVHTTTCTFIAGADLIRRHRRSFYRYDGYENLSINRVWAKEVCLAPCGWTHAEHLHLSDLSPVQKLLP